MPNTINLHLLDNKQIKVDKGGIPLGNENSYRIYEHEENVTQFEIVSKPAEYENADYYVIFINSQNKRAFLNDIIPDPVTDDGQLIVDDTFMLPIGMAVKGYGYIRIYAIQDNERVEFQPIKIKVWDTVDAWKDYVTDLNTPATEEWVTENFATITQLNAKQNKIDSSHKLSADLIADGSTNKVFTATEKTKLSGIAAGAQVNTVNSVSGKTGTVTLNADDISETTNKKFVTSAEKTDIAKISTIELAYGATLEFSVNSSTYVLTAVLKNKNGTALSTQTVDLPLESVVVNGSYNNSTKSLILTLQNGNTITVPVGDLISGLQTEIDSSHKLSADLVDDTSTTNKFVNASEKAQISTNASDISDINGKIPSTASSSNKLVDKAQMDALQQKIEGGQIPAGLAKQIENISDDSGSYQNKPFLYQSTGTDSNTTETPTAPIAKHFELRGNTVVFNQLVDTSTTEIIPTVGHKYLTMINDVKSIITPADDTPISVSGGTDNVFDFTKMFVAGKEPTSVVQFNRLFPLPYYAYNAGELKSCQSNKLITVGYNQFENLNQFIRVIAGQTYRLMYFDGTALASLSSGSIVEYDGAKNEIKTTTYGNLADLHTLNSSYPDNGDVGIKLTDETQYVKIISVSESNILFNIAWDGSRSDYEAYVKHEYNLPNIELKSAGDVYDSCYPDGSRIQRVGSVDLGSLTWTYETEEWGAPYFISDEINTLKLSSTNFTTPKYKAVHWDGSFQSTDIIITNYARRIIIKDSAYTDATAFTTALSGVMCNYELASPAEQPSTSFAENIEVDDFGTMEFTTSETESASNPIVPQGNKFFYPADYVLLMDDLYNYTNGDVQVLAKKSDMSGKQDKLVQSTDLTPTTQTLTLTANNRYALGTLTALNLTFPTTNLNDGDEIIIEFVSGSTATTLTLDNVNAIYNFSSVGANKFVELNAQFKVSIGKWVVYSAETDYTVV